MATGDAGVKPGCLDMRVNSCVYCVLIEDLRCDRAKFLRIASPKLRGVLEVMAALSYPAVTSAWTVGMIYATRFDRFQIWASRRGSISIPGAASARSSFGAAVRQPRGPPTLAISVTTAAGPLLRTEPH